MYKFLKKQKLNNENYANPSKRFIAYAIDNAIITLVRYLIFIICYKIWFGKTIMIFLQEYQNILGTTELKLIDNKNLFAYFINSSIFLEFLFLVFIIFILGSLYWIIFPIKFAGTIGKKICKIKIVTIKNKNINISTAIYRYLIGLVPWGFHIIVIFALTAKNIPLLIATILIISFWYEINIFGRSYRSVHDHICSTKVIKND